MDLPHNEQLSSIKFIPRQEASLIRPSTHELEDYLSRIKGKWAKQMANEIRMMFNNYLRNGYFKFHNKLLNHIYGNHFRKELEKAIRPFTKIVKSAGKKCSHRVFMLKGIKTTTSEWPTYNGNDLIESYTIYPSDDQLTYRTIPTGFLNHRYESWCDFCEKNNLPNNIDFDGRTEWGAALLETQRSLLVPLVAPEPDDRRGYDEQDREAFKQHSQNRLDKYQAGICNVAIRRHGRVYHITTGLPIEVRRRMLIDLEGTVEIDLHATYWALLIMMMPDCEEKDILTQIYQNEGFYSIFDFSILQPGVNRKVEVMKQCLFLNNNDALPPLRQQLRSRFPRFDAFIAGLRADHTPTGLSHILTEAEGRIFIDKMIPAIARLGVKPNSNHDGIIVPVSSAEVVWNLMVNMLADYLGFAPRLNAKGMRLNNKKNNTKLAN